MSLFVDEEEDADGLSGMRLNTGVVSRGGVTTDYGSEDGNRLDCLDAMRGLALFLMVFVNYGPGFSDLGHAPWDGLQLADVLFPAFVFMMGISIPLAFDKADAKAEVTTPARMLKIFRRAASLYLLGLFINYVSVGWSHQTVRYCGVLQRMAIAYAAVSLLYCCLPRFDRPEHPLRDILAIITQHVAAVVLLLLPYQLLVSLYNVPSCRSDGSGAAGYVGPGGLSNDGRYYNCTGGFVGWFDAEVLGYKHMWGDPTCASDPAIRCPLPFDPEGLWGALTTSYSCFLGLQAGSTILHFRAVQRSEEALALRLSGWGIVLIGIGLGLCSFDLSGEPVPVNKNLWSVSFVFVNAGIDYLVLVGMYLLIDVAKAGWRGLFFRHLGMNSIFIYCAHLLCQGWIPWLNPQMFSLRSYSDAEQMAASLAASCLWAFVATILYQRRVFISV